MSRPLDLKGTDPTSSWCVLVVILAAVLGLGLMAHQAVISSATYDEVTYLQVAAQWWKTGDCGSITRMGSPLTFFKIQTAPLFFLMDLTGNGHLIDGSVEHQPLLLPWVRWGLLWIWLIAFGLTSEWSRRIYGPRAMACAACLFALSPNLLAHGGLLTMELPLVATTTAMVFCFWNYLESRRPWAWMASALLGGVAFSCKFTTVLFPPILGILWLIDLRARRETSFGRSLWIVIRGMLLYVVVILLSNLVITGFAVTPLSERSGNHPSLPGFLARLAEIPLPSDWVGFATQLKHQRNGGPSYLLGERRMSGWWQYYPVAMAAKIPIACGLLILLRCGLALKITSIKHDWMLPVTIGIFLAIAMLGSKRNYGIRYLLPLAPLAIVWISMLAERGKTWRWIVGLGLIGQAVAIASIHPHELSFFNQLAGGTLGGRRILADSNLDWGQGLKSLARIQNRYQPLSVFYFGDTPPATYGVEGDIYWINANQSLRALPTSSCGWKRFVAVSASLQHGPWGPEGYFKELDRLTPIAFTDDGTIAIYDRGSAQ